MLKVNLIATLIFDIFTFMSLCKTFFECKYWTALTIFTKYYNALSSLNGPLNWILVNRHPPLQYSSNIYKYSLSSNASTIATIFGWVSLDYILISFLKLEMSV